MEYEDLIELNQAGEISDLEFLLAQEELAELFLKDMKEKGKEPNNQLAIKWLVEYENNHLYNNLP